MAEVSHRDLSASGGLWSHTQSAVGRFGAESGVDQRGFDLRARAMLVEHVGQTQNWVAEIIERRITDPTQLPTDMGVLAHRPPRVAGVAVGVRAAGRERVLG